MSNTLFELTGEMAVIENELENNGGELTPELESALSFTQEALVQKVDGISALVRKFEANAEACKNEKARVATLQKQAENAVKNLKAMVLWTMGTYGIEKIEGKTTKFSRRHSEKMEVNEDVLIAGYQHQINELKASLPEWMKVSVTIDKTALKNAIKQDGVLPEGAQISDNYTLQIK